MSNLVHRTVDGWDLCSRDGAAWWIRDLEVARRAGMLNQHDIRTHIAAMQADGVLAEFQVLVGGENLNSAGIRDEALFITETVLVPMPRGRGHKSVDEYLLNRKASVLLLMRLRTPTALAQIDNVVSVFLRVVDGDLTGAELRALREDRAALGAEIALMKLEVVQAKAELAEVKSVLLLGSGYVSKPQRDLIRYAKKRAAAARVAASLAANLRSANRALQNGMMAATGWGGRGQRDALLPVDLFTRVLAYFEGEAAMLERAIARKSQLKLFRGGRS